MARHGITNPFTVFNTSVDVFENGLQSTIGRLVPQDRDGLQQRHSTLQEARELKVKVGHQLAVHSSTKTETRLAFFSAGNGDREQGLRTQHRDDLFFRGR